MGNLSLRKTQSVPKRTKISAYLDENFQVTKQQKISLLKRTSLFNCLSEVQLENLIAEMREQTLPANTIFIEEGSSDNLLYFIVSGLTCVFRTTEEGREVMVTMRKPGEFVGEMALIDNSPRSASVKTLQTTYLLVLTKNQFLDLIYKNPLVAVEMLRILSERIRENVNHIESIATKDLVKKTEKILQTLAPYFKHHDVLLSQEELASLIGATRPRVTEALNVLATKGTITLSPKQIHVNS